MDGESQRGWIFYQRRNILENNAGFWKVGNVADFIYVIYSLFLLFECLCIRPLKVQHNSLGSFQEFEDSLYQ